MGFGLLFIGYILMLYPVDTLLVGFSALLMLPGLIRLRGYNAGLGRAFWLAFPVMLAGGARFLLFVLGYLGYPIHEQDELTMLVAIAGYIALLLFHASLCRGLSDIADETKLIKLRFVAWRNMIFSTLYFLARAIFELDLDIPSGFYVAAFPIILLIGIIIAGLNLLMLFSFYRNICLPGQEMPEPQLELPDPKKP